MLVSLISKEIEQNTNNEYALRTSGTGINHWNLTFVEPKKLSKNYLLLKEELHNTLVNNRHYVRQSQSKVISESTDGWQFTAKTRLNEWRQKKTGWCFSTSSVQKWSQNTLDWSASILCWWHPMDAEELRRWVLFLTSPCLNRKRGSAVNHDFSTYSTASPNKLNINLVKRGRGYDL